MDATLQGFRIGSLQTCTLLNVANYMCSISGQKFQFYESERMLFAGMRDAKCVGVLLTLKDQRRFPEISFTEDFKVFIREVEEGHSPFDFNFFAFDPATHAGVYQHYRGSCSSHRFGLLLGRLYDDLARNQCVADKETLLQRENNYRLRSDRLEFAMVYKRETFEELVGNLEVASSFQYDVVTQADMSEATAPLHPFAKLERKTIKFQPATRGQTIVGALKAILPQVITDRMFRVVGYDAEGELHRIDYVSPPPDQFAKDNVDELADEFILSFGNITQSPYVDRMLEVLAQNPALLGPEAEL